MTKGKRKGNVAPDVAFSFIIERLDQARLDVINSPKKIHKTDHFGTLILQTLYQDYHLSLSVLTQLPRGTHMPVGTFLPPISTILTLALYNLSMGTVCLL